MSVTAERRFAEIVAALVTHGPPDAPGRLVPALDAARAGNWLAPQSLVVWEEGSAPTLPEGFTLEDQRKYGDTLVTIARAP